MLASFCYRIAEALALTLPARAADEFAALLAPAVVAFRPPARRLRRAPVTRRA